MSYDSIDNSTSDPERPSASDEKQEKRPFVKPELRREMGVVDGTGSSVSWDNSND